MVGCGYWGQNILRNLASLGALGAVVDADRVVANRFAAENRVRALSGKDVFVEKPLALDLIDAEELCRVAEAGNRILMVGHLLQYHTAFVKLKELIDTGELGRLQYIYSNRVNLGKIRREENILWSFAPHDISMILSLVDAEPIEVSTVGAAYLHEIVGDVTVTHLASSNGTRAHIFVSWLHPYNEQKLVAVGDTGMAVFDDSLSWDSKLTLYRHKIEWRNGMPQPAKAEGVPIAIEPVEPLNLECRHFLECVVSRKTPRTDGR